MRKEIEDFLQKKGSVEVILEIGSGSSTYKDIAKTVLISSSTISSRLTTGVEIDLFELTQRPTEYGTEKRYKLTRKGSEVHEIIDIIDMDVTVRELQRIQRKYNNNLDHLLSLLSRHEEFTDDRATYSEPSEEELEHIDDVPEKERIHNKEKKSKRERVENKIVGKIDKNDENENN